MTHGSLFSGIGGFDLAAEWAGWENKFHCEWNEFGQRVLKYYWPDAVSYGDITKTDFTVWRGRIDVLTGGFPCQPYSVAGKRKGKEDERHLWPEMLRAIREIQPHYIVGENVPGLINWNGGLVFDEVQSDLEAEGYEVIPFILPAASVNAPHKRDRIWFIAHANDQRGCTGFGSISETNGEIHQRNENAEPGNASTENLREQEVCAGEFKATSNPTGDGLYDESTQENNIIRQNNKQSGAQWKRTAERFGNEWNVANANNIGLQNAWAEQQTTGITGSCKDGNAANASSARREKFDLPGFANGSRYGTRGNNADKTDWQNFPTQSPVCDGDDGLSTRLAGITFPKFRNESIKAGGNAIVPQVAFQIFKAINEFESINF
jgi:DNA (cytosine-5)-methyltransferase 1